MRILFATRLLVLFAVFGASRILEADPVPDFSFPAAPAKLEIPRTRAMDSSGEARFTRSRPATPANLPASAPRTFAEAMALSWVDPEDFALSFSDSRPGFYSVAGGGRAYQWMPGQWSLELPGMRVMRWTNGTSQVEIGENRIIKFPNLQWPGALEWTFSDRSKLKRLPRPQESTVEFIYESEAPNRAAFQIREPGKWAKESTSIERYSIEYSPAWQDHIDAFRAWGKSTQYFAKMEELFGFKNPGPVPVLFFQELTDIRRQMRIPDVGEGGRGGLYGIWICCGAKAKPFSSEPAVRAVQMQTESFPVLLHETVHNLQQHRCYYVRQGQDLPPAQDPGPWFVEGIAEVGMMQMLPRDRARKYRELYEKLDANQSVTVASFSRGELPVYTYGTFMLEYVMQTRGASAIRSFYDDVCRGTPPVSAAQKHLGSDPEGLLQASLAYFRANRARFEPQMETWAMEGLPQVSYAKPDAVLRESDLVLPASNRSIRSIPDIWNALRMNTQDLNGKFEGTLRGPAGERVQIWKNGTAEVRSGDMKVLYFGEDSTNLTLRGHTIVQWKNGTRKWTLPDGSSATQFGSQMQYADKNGKPAP